MRYVALATDFDGTLATDGVVAGETADALRRLRASGRALLLVTGRELDDLRRTFSGLDLFDRVVAENGAVLYRPEDGSERLLVDPPPPAFARRLRARGVAPLGFGRVIVATREPHQHAVLDVIRELGLEMQIEFNKGAVMALPSGVNKRSGLGAALAELRLSAHNTVGIGDAENDQAFLRACECGIAVANALPVLKQEVDWVTAGASGAGVVELVERLLADDLRSIATRVVRHAIVLGTDAAGRAVGLRPSDGSLLVVGADRTARGRVAGKVVAGLAERGYQVCALNGDEETRQGTRRGMIEALDGPPPPDDVLRRLQRPEVSVQVSLSALTRAERRGYTTALLARSRSLYQRMGRPHWLALDAADELLGGSAGEDGFRGSKLLATAWPERLARGVLEDVALVMAVGAAPREALRAAARALQAEMPRVPAAAEGFEALVWARQPGHAAVWVRLDAPGEAAGIDSAARVLR